MRKNEAVRHERSAAHRQNVANLGNDWNPQVDEEAWGLDDNSVFDSLRDWKYEGTLETMPVRVRTWIKGVKFAEAGREWRMEVDYKVEEHAPLEEWTMACAETWAMSNTASPALPEKLAELDCREMSYAYSPQGQTFLKCMARKERPDHLKRQRWTEFFQVSFY